MHKISIFLSPLLLFCFFFSNMPLFFADSELSWLRGSFALQKLEEQRSGLVIEYNNLCSVLPDFATKYSLRDFMWARCVVLTRVFGLVTNDQQTEGLVPFADMYV